MQYKKRKRTIKSSFKVGKISRKTIRDAIKKYKENHNAI